MFTIKYVYVFCLSFRYLNVHPEVEERKKKWQDALEEYIITGCSITPPHWLDVLGTINSQGSLSLHEQFDFLSLLPNDPYAKYIDYAGNLCDSSPSVLEHLLFQEPSSKSVSDDPKPNRYPTSMRQRLLYFTLNDTNTLFDTAYVGRMCNFYLTQFTGVTPSDENAGSESHGKPPKIRRYAERTVDPKETPQQPETLTVNHYLPGCLYKDFREHLILHGRISFRLRTQDGGIVLLNDYCPKTGHFLPLSFVHLSFQSDCENLTFECSCVNYSFIMQAQENGMERNQLPDTCFHCRFAAEHLYDLCKSSSVSHQLKSLDNGAVLDKLLENNNELNSGVVILSSGDNKTTVKMSVLSKEQNCAFVHLSSCRSYVHCEDGACKAAMRNKKKTLTICHLKDHSKVCSHLQTLHSNAEVWTHFLDSNEQDDNEGGGDYDHENVRIFNPCIF